MMKKDLLITLLLVTKILFCSQGVETNGVGDSVTQIHERLFLGIKKNRKEEILEALHAGADINKIHPNLNVSPLELAIRKRRFGLIKLLLKEGADPRCGKPNRSHYSVVIKKGRYPFVPLFLSKKIPYLPKEIILSEQDEAFLKQKDIRRLIKRGCISVARILFRNKFLKQDDLNVTLNFSKEVETLLKSEHVSSATKAFFNAIQRAETCAICRDGMLPTIDILEKTKCQHCFHRQCLLTWIETKNSCPLCRYDNPLEKEQ